MQNEQNCPIWKKYPKHANDRYVIQNNYLQSRNVFWDFTECVHRGLIHWRFTTGQSELAERLLWHFTFLVPNYNISKVSKVSYVVYPENANPLHFVVTSILNVTLIAHLRITHQSKLNSLLGRYQLYATVGADQGPGFGPSRPRAMVLSPTWFGN